MAFWFDGGEVRPGGLDVNRRNLLPQDIRECRLDGRISASVQDESVFSAEQTTSIRPKRQVFAIPSGVPIHEFGGGDSGPTVLHIQTRSSYVVGVASLRNAAAVVVAGAQSSCRGRLDCRQHEPGVFLRRLPVED